MKFVDLLPLCIAAAMLCACSDDTNDVSDINVITTMDSATFFQVSEEIQTENSASETEEAVETSEE